MNNAICPECGERLTEKQFPHGRLAQCYKCGYSLNIQTGAVSHFNPDTSSAFIVKCPHCDAKIRAIDVSCGDMLQCSVCAKSFRIPEHPDPNLKLTVTCPSCNGKNSVAANKGKLKVTCGHCNTQFIYNSGTWPAMKQQTPPPRSTVSASKAQPTEKPPQQQAKRPESTQPTRTITIERLTHAHKEWNLHGLRNRFMDAYPVHIFLDDTDQGLLTAESPMTLHLSSEAHTLKSAILASTHNIPAGNHSYGAFFFNDAFMICPKEDFFCSQIMSFMVHIFKGDGIRDRILDSNNRNHNVAFDIGPKGIRLYWQAATTKGLKQWVTGEEEEWIRYSDIDLEPLAPEYQPDGYWDFVKLMAEEAILKDAGMERHLGGFTFKSRSNLW